MTGNCLGALIETGRLIERYTPLSRSRIWELNTAYWEARGAAAFMQDAVPYVATNDGSLSTATAEVVAAYALGLEAPRRLTVLEIGPGSGIFARILIARYAHLRRGGDMLPPMRYIFVDSSANMLAGLKDALTVEGADCELAFIRGNPPAGAFVSRMYSAPLSPAVRERFAEVFSFAGPKRAHELVGLARQAQSDGRLGGAISAYEQALEGNETNWSLLTEVAGFVCHRLGRADEALELARQALAINPLCAEALDVAGECHFRMGDIQAARGGFERVLEIRPADARALLNLAYCDAREGKLARALGQIAKAIAADVDGNLTGELLERQRELVQRIQKGGAAGSS